MRFYQSSFLAFSLIASMLVLLDNCYAGDTTPPVQSAQSQDDILSMEVRPVNANIVPGEPLRLAFGWRIAGFVEPNKGCWLYFAVQNSRTRK